MLPYINPNYFAQQYNNPYMQTQYMPQITTQNATNSAFKVVEGIDMVKTAEIPMDGNIYYFPTADGKKIFTKQWLNNGSTKISEYLPQNDTKSEEVDILSTNDIKREIGALSKQIMALKEDINTLTDNIRPQKTSKRSANNEPNADN